MTKSGGSLREREERPEPNSLSLSQTDALYVRGANVHTGQSSFLKSTHVLFVMRAFLLHLGHGLKSRHDL